MVEKTNKQDSLKPLKVTCTSAKCESALHCFKPTRKMKLQGKTGKCRYCRADLIDWKRIYKLDLKEVEYVFKSLKYEMFRHYMWHVEIDIRAVNYARRKGKIGLRKAVENRLRKYIGIINPPYDGRQTKREGSGNPIFYAQHATATCCRKCAEYWYGIPQDREFSEEEIHFFTELIMLYIKERLPMLTDDGERVPRIKHSNKL